MRLGTVHIFYLIGTRGRCANKLQVLSALRRGRRVLKGPYQDICDAFCDCRKM